MEVYNGDSINYIAPLENNDQFYVPEVIAMGKSDGKKEQWVSIVGLFPSDLPKMDMHLKAAVLSYILLQSWHFRVPLPNIDSQSISNNNYRASL